MKKLILMAVVGLVLLFGCTSSLNEIIRSDANLKEVFSVHPHADLVVVPYSKEKFDMESSFWGSGCLKPYQINDYFFVTIMDVDYNYKALFERGNIKFVCGVEERRSSSSNPNNTNHPTTCFGIGGIKCNNGESCTSGWLSASDTNQCCSGTCFIGQKANACQGITPVTCYSVTQKCVEEILADGNSCGCARCEEKTCFERGGNVCPSGFTCSGRIVDTIDTHNCCIDYCYTVDVTYTDVNDANN